MPKKIVIPAIDDEWDDINQEFINLPSVTLLLEHSLVSISKWESKWHVPFLKERAEKTPEQTLDYIRCMTLTQCVDPEVYSRMPASVLEEINEYIGDPMSATTIPNRSSKGSGPNRETITSELIYYWMVAYNIPFECQKWHLNRLLKLIEVCMFKQDQQQNGPSKMSKSEIMARNRKLNAARRKRLHSKG